MYKRLIIISVIILAALCGLAVLGVHSISLQEEGLAAKRYAQFTETAEQIRLDVKYKLDTFIQTEQKRLYTDYQYYYIPESSNDKQALVRSPLAGAINHGLAYGHFQIEPDGSIITPFYDPQQQQASNTPAEKYIANIKQNVVTALNGSGTLSGVLKLNRISLKKPPSADKKDSYLEENETQTDSISIFEDKSEKLNQPIAPTKEAASQQQAQTSKRSKGKAYRIGALEKQQQAKTARQSRSRANVQQNIFNNMAGNSSLRRQESAPGMQMMQPMAPGGLSGPGGMPSQRFKPKPQEDTQQTESLQTIAVQSQEGESSFKDYDTVQIRIEPFSSIVVPTPGWEDSIFDGQVFLLRHIQIEQRHFMQGFRLNEAELVNIVKESAQKLLRKGMGFDLSSRESETAAHAAILVFDFGQMVLNLTELDPAWINAQVGELRNWYFAIIAIVFIAAILAIVSLWRNVNIQIKLARKKDDFISAVSHELRTPLTTIRMYTEMLEKNWVRTDEKRAEYYTSMRQESERLSRLIENVLDFSRIQRGRKKYFFKSGNINTCVSDMVDMMAPLAQQAGFVLEKDFTHIEPIVFDADAVMQIVINLLDNAIKYASEAKEKTITVRTRRHNQYILIEVEDHGPGVPHLQRKKVFDEFYRIGDESKRETTGTGLGLALVKKFAQAHNGFVEILTAKPKGVIFRVALAAQT